MLDDQNVIAQRDTKDALGVAAKQWQQTEYAPSVEHPDNDGRPITNVVVAGMGGSALAALLVKTWLNQDLTMPFEVVRDYELPSYVGPSSLVIASSYSGNTEETMQCLAGATKAGAQLAIITAGGKLGTAADASSIACVKLPADFQPRMAMLYNLSALLTLLVHFGIVEQAKIDELRSIGPWLQEASSAWLTTVPESDNLAKQLAKKSAGKIPVIYGGGLTAPAAYKWKISWNENAKNVAFWNQYPEMNHNEFIGWTSHPIEKPFVIFDLISPLEHPQTIKRFFASDQLLSGKRPAAVTVKLAGDTALKQLVWACILADFASIYAAILNGVDPTPVELIEKLKLTLSGD